MVIWVLWLKAAIEYISSATITTTTAMGTSEEDWHDILEKTMNMCICYWLHSQLFFCVNIIILYTISVVADLVYVISMYTTLIITRIYFVVTIIILDGFIFSSKIYIFINIIDYCIICSIAHICFITIWICNIAIGCD